MLYSFQPGDDTAASNIGFDTLTAARSAFRFHRLSLVAVPREIEIRAVLRSGKRYTVAIFPDHEDQVLCHVAGNDGAWYEACRVRGRDRYDAFHLSRTEGNALVLVIPPNDHDQRGA